MLYTYPARDIYIYNRREWLLFIQTQGIAKARD